MKLLDSLNKLLFSQRNKQSDNNLGKVLVVSNTGFGDTILSTPAIKSLRKSFLNEKIIFLVNKKPFFSKKLKKKNALWRKRRQEFYGDVDTNNMSIQFLTSFYTELFKSLGLNTVFANSIPRHNPHLDYFIFLLRKNHQQNNKYLKTVDWISLYPLLSKK